MLVTYNLKAFPNLLNRFSRASWRVTDAPYLSRISKGRGGSVVGSVPYVQKVPL